MISVSAKYAIRVIQFLAQEDSGGAFVRVEELARATDIPAPYLSKVVKNLSVGGLLETKKGLNGGARISPLKKSSEISFYDVCKVVRDPIIKESCFLSKYECDLANLCEVHQNWSKLQEDTLSFLQKQKVLDPNSNAPSCKQTRPVENNRPSQFNIFK